MVTPVLKVLGQIKPPATTLSTLYAAPSQAVASTLSVCNQSGSPTMFRVSIRVAGAADDPKQYIYYDVVLGGNDTFMATIGLSLGPTDIVSVYALNATLSFNLFGQELTP